MAEWTCGWCNKPTFMKRILNEARQEKVGYSDYVNSMAYECANCHRMSVATWSSDEYNEKEPNANSEQIWYPAFVEGQTFEDVPKHIAEAASEAYRCHSIGAYRGALAIARAVVEASAKKVDAKGKNLFERIDTLKRDGHVRPIIADAAHEVRHLGNDVAHGDFVEPVSSEESAEALGFMSDLLDDLFQMPARVKRRKDQRAERAGRSGT